MPDKSSRMLIQEGKGGMGIGKPHSLRVDALSYALSFMLHIVLSVHFAVAAWGNALTWEGAVLSAGFLLLAVDMLVTSYWLQRFGALPTAIFCALGDTLLFVFCAISLRATLLLIYIVAAVVVIVVFISFHSIMILDAYHRSIALVASGLLAYLYIAVSRNPLYLTLPLILVLYAFVLPLQALGRKTEALIVMVSALMNALSVTGLLG